ncbi:MAG TPA: prepilin-type N-terminal cleavage/methylation domain-containing protein [Egicoccus sp.]|nr:prepilin-type N-terminal cleavage/methylation domain-containing protein [Egicoccus sp.]HSK21859.1 prepilin-type N-terminal cleavage/methylation domain-containing protein [Egicoccus sp.]
MLSTIRTKRDEEGFTLIELLVVVIIIGILAAIAIPVFLNQRENAWRAAAESDARNAAIEIESYYTRESAYPADFTIGGDTPVAPADPIDINVSDNVTLTYDQDGGTDGGWLLTATHADVDGSVSYDPALGGVQDWADPVAPPE